MHTPQPQTGLSIVATIYRTGRYLEEFARRSFAAAEQAGYSPEAVEMVLVNDGCPEDGLDAALALRTSFPQVRVIDLSRNFGHHKAMMAGLREARGEHIFLIDSDLEEAPEWLADFGERMQSEACDAVYGVQATRKGGRFERLGGGLFYTLFNLLATPPITPNSVTARLMTREFVDALVQYGEAEPFLFGLAALAGFKQCPCTIHKGQDSPTSYTFRRKLRLAVHSIVSFSAKPLLYIAVSGFIITCLAFLYVAFICIRALLDGAAPEGWTTMVASIWLVGGFIILCIGIVSLYLAQIFTEVKKRPVTVIKKRYE